MAPKRSLADIYAQSRTHREWNANSRKSLKDKYDSFRQREPYSRYGNQNSGKEYLDIGKSTVGNTGHTLGNTGHTLGNTGHTIGKTTGISTGKTMGNGMKNSIGSWIGSAGESTLRKDNAIEKGAPEYGKDTLSDRRRGFTNNLRGTPWSKKLHYSLDTDAGNTANRTVFRTQAGKVSKPKNTPGLFGKVKKLFSNLGLEWESPAYKELEKSMTSLEQSQKNIFRVEPTPETVDYNKIFRLRDPETSWDDEVSRTLESRWVSEEKAKLERLQMAMQQKLEKELEKRRDAEMDHERKLYLLKSDFEARIFAIEERMETMKREADEHSRLARAQNTAELMEQKEAMYMSQIEASTKIRRLNELISEKEKEMEAMKKTLEQLRERPTSQERPTNQTIPPNAENQIHQATNEANEQIIRDILHNSEGPAENSHVATPKVSLVENDEFLQNQGVQTENAVISFYEALQKSPRTLVDNGQLHMLGSQELSKKVEHLLRELDAKPDLHKMASQLDDYEKYFDSCRIIRDKDPRHMRQLYQKKTIDDIENYFKQVIELTQAKIRRNRTRVKQCDSQTSGPFHGLTLRKAEKIASQMEVKISQLTQYRQNTALVQRLGDLMRKIAEVRHVCSQETDIV